MERKLLAKEKLGMKISFITFLTIDKNLKLLNDNN
jgi:hypothetical protein